MRRFVRNIHSSFTEVRREPEPERFLEMFCPAEEPTPHILSEAECAERIRRMKAEGRMPTFEQFHRVVEDVLDEIDAERGEGPRERIFPRRVKRVQSKRPAPQRQGICSVPRESSCGRRPGGP